MTFFYRKGLRTYSQWGSLEGLSISYANGERKLGFQKHEVNRPVPKCRKAVLSGCVGGDKKDPSIFLKFKHSNKQVMLTQNLASKPSYCY